MALSSLLRSSPMCLYLLVVFCSCLIINLQEVLPETPTLESCMLLQAEERQKTFEQSAVGRAAYKSVAEAKRVETRPNENNTARDWQS